MMLKILNIGRKHRFSTRKKIWSLDGFDDGPNVLAGLGGGP